MRLGTAIAIYFIIWWVMLFVTLPWGARSAHEAGEEVGPGHAPSAPLKPMMIRKIVATSILAAVAFAGYWWASAHGFLSPANWTFMSL
jgi:predicted secreted protein